MAKTNRKAQTVVADVCLYGTTWTGAGYLGVRYPHGQTFGTGDPVKERSFTEAIMRAQFDLRAAGSPDGLIRLFDAGGERVATFGLNEAVIYGGLTWAPAPVYAISAEALEAAATRCPDDCGATGCVYCDPAMTEEVR